MKGKDCGCPFEKGGKKPAEKPVKGKADKMPPFMKPVPKKKKGK
jgi:hypothetical protein